MTESSDQRAEQIKVFLLDDHEIVRRGLRDLLEGEGDIVVVGEASTESEAVGRVRALDPDVAVLDVRLQDGDGIAACREIRSRHPRTACLILTSFADDEALFAAIMAGAAGYVLKQIRTNDLVDAVRRVAAGQNLLDPAVTARVLERLRRGPEEDERIARLSQQERQVLTLLAEGLTNRQIAERLYLAEKTIKNYVTSVLTKMGMARRTEAAVYAARHLKPEATARSEWDLRPWTAGARGDNAGAMTTDQFGMEVLDAGDVLGSAARQRGRPLGGVDPRPSRHLPRQLRRRQRRRGLPHRRGHQAGRGRARSGRRLRGRRVRPRLR